LLNYWYCKDFQLRS